MSDLLRALKEGSSQKVRSILRDRIPAETLLPFVLKKCLRKDRLDLDEIRYVKSCFRMFSDLRCLDGEDQRRCAETHRLAFVTEAACIMDHTKDYLDAGRDVGMVFKEFTSLYNDKKLLKQLTYFVLACNRRSRFAAFKKDAPKMHECQQKRLKRKALCLVEEFIRRM